MKFKLIKIYHKPYRLFTEDYVFNLGNTNCVKKNEDNIKWLNENMNCCPTFDHTHFNVMNSEWTPIYEFLNSKESASFNDYFLTFQHYSKVLDLKTISDVPYHDMTQTEDKAGEKYQSAKTLDEFGYNDIDSYLLNYDVIVGNQYPCNIQLSIRSNMKLNINEVLHQYFSILHNFNDPLFTKEQFVKYCQLSYQYWRGGPIICPFSIHKRLIDFTIAFEHAFLDSKLYDQGELYKNNDGRGNGYLGEMIIGFAIYCYIEECKRLGKKVGYCHLYTDSNVIFGNSQT